MIIVHFYEMNIFIITQKWKYKQEKRETSWKFHKIREYNLNLQTCKKAKKEYYNNMGIFMTKIKREENI